MAWARKGERQTDRQAEREREVVRRGGGERERERESNGGKANCHKFECLRGNKILGEKVVHHRILEEANFFCVSSRVSSRRKYLEKVSSKRRWGERERERDIRRGS